MNDPGCVCEEPGVKPRSEKQVRSSLQNHPAKNMPDSPTGASSPLPPGGGLPPEPQKQIELADGGDERRNSLMTRLSTTHKDVKDIGEDELFNMLDKDHSGTLSKAEFTKMVRATPRNSSARAN